MKTNIKNKIIALVALSSALFNTAAIASVNSCPVSNPINRSIIEDFLTKASWSEKRTASGMSSVTISNITLLTDSTYVTTCTSLNTIYVEALQELNGLGEQAYNVTYYEAGGKFVVVITLRQSATPGYVTMGINFIHIYDQNLELSRRMRFRVPANAFETSKRFDRCRTINDFG